MTTESKLQLLNTYLEKQDVSALLVLRDAMENELRETAQRSAGTYNLAKAMAAICKSADRPAFQKPFRSGDWLCAISGYHGILTHEELDLDLGECSVNVQQMLDDSIESLPVHPLPSLAELKLELKLQKARHTKGVFTPLLKIGEKFYNLKYLITVSSGIKDGVAVSSDAKLTPLYIYNYHSVGIVLPVRVSR
jgi:hypothetical protein